MFYAESIAFNSVYHVWVVDAFDAVCRYGALTGQETFRMPSMHGLRNKLLDGEVARLEEELKKYEAAVAEFGVSIQSDGKDSMGKRHLVNIISSNPSGSRFHKTVDVSGSTRDTQHTAGLLVDAAREIAAQGQRHVVSIVTDTPNVNRAAWKIIEKELPSTMCTPCAAHCMNLHLKHCVTKLAGMKDFVEQCKVIVKRFSNVDFARDLVRKNVRAYTTDDDHPAGRQLEVYKP